MITKVTRENQDLYRELFDDINGALEKAGHSYKIETITEYFLHLEDIVQLVSGNLEYTYFLHLPTDEYVFSIDANTRVIKVPQHFKSNGIAVAGDHLAETLWFKVDEYYDMQDLNSLSINIYWELPGTKEKGKSEPQFKYVKSDDEEESNFILFGWTIPEQLTKQAGNLVFSIEFYESETAEGALPYSFNTLPQTVKIQFNNLINADKYTSDETDFNTVVTRLKNSNFNSIFVAPPIFSTYDPMPALMVAEDMIIDGEGPELFASAYGSLAANVTIIYDWHDGTRSLGPGTSAYHAVPYDKIIPQQLYYSSDEALLGYGDSAAVQAAKDQNATIYEFGSKYQVTKIGNYQVRATARVTIEGATPEEDKVGTSRLGYGKVWIFESTTPIKASDYKFEITENGIIRGTANKPVISVTTIDPDQIQGQQKFAIWSYEIYKVGEEDPVAINTSYTVTEAGEYYAKIHKKLNDDVKSTETIKLVAQQGATAMSVANNTDTKLILKGSNIPELTYTCPDAPEGQRYQYFVYYKDYSTGKWKDAKYSNNLVAPNANNYAPTAVGSYAIIVKSIYGKDEAYSYPESELDSHILFTVYSLT